MTQHEAIQHVELVEIFDLLDEEGGEINNGNTDKLMSQHQPYHSQSVAGVDLRPVSYIIR